MLIKQLDSKDEDLEILRHLSTHPRVPDQTKKNITSKIATMETGIRGEKQAAYEIDFHYKNSDNWAIIHDLRIEYDGNIAQIDHLLINRILDIWVIETKYFSRGVMINEHLEFTTEYNNKQRGITSPIAQNKKHISVLRAALKSDFIATPKRMGLSIPFKLNSLVLFADKTLITRPKGKSKELESIIKIDQLKDRIDKRIDKLNPIELGKAISSETLRDFANEIVSLQAGFGCKTQVFQLVP